MPVRRSLRHGLFESSIDSYVLCSAGSAHRHSFNSPWFAAVNREFPSGGSLRSRLREPSIDGSPGQRGPFFCLDQVQRWRRRDVMLDSASSASAPGAGVCAGIFALPRCSLSPPLKALPCANFMKRATNA